MEQSIKISDTLAFNALVVNDHLSVRKGLKSIVDKFPVIKHSDVAENGKVAIEKMKQHHYAALKALQIFQC